MIHPVQCNFAVSIQHVIQLGGHLMEMRFGSIDIDSVSPRRGFVRRIRTTAAFAKIGAP